MAVKLTNLEKIKVAKLNLTVALNNLHNSLKPFERTIDKLQLASKPFASLGATDMLHLTNLIIEAFSESEGESSNTTS
jgi:hypothetical protein